MSMLGLLVPGLISGVIGTGIVNETGENRLLDVFVVMDSVVGAGLVISRAAALAGIGSQDTVHPYSMILAATGGIAVLILWRARRRRAEAAAV